MDRAPPRRGRPPAGKPVIGSSTPATGKLTAAPSRKRAFSGAPPNRTLEARGYKWIRQIGKGAFGRAILVQDRDGHGYVVKEVKLSNMPAAEKELARMEIKVLRTVGHPNIVRYIDHFEDSSTLYIVMEYADSGDLSKVLKGSQSGSLPETLVLDYFVQIGMALQHIHGKQILHRDLKPQNIFLSKNKKLVKLGDFGISTILRTASASAKTQCGTPYYFSPELCQHKPYNNKSDIWALGCLLYEMLTGRRPFDGANLRLLMSNICSGKYTPLPRSYSKEVQDLVKEMLSHDPKKRPSMSRILEMDFIRDRLEQFLPGHKSVYGAEDAGAEETPEDAQREAAKKKLEEARKEEDEHRRHRERERAQFREQLEKMREREQARQRERDAHLEREAQMQAKHEKERDRLRREREAAEERARERDQREERERAQRAREEKAREERRREEEKEKKREEEKLKEERARAERVRQRREEREREEREAAEKAEKEAQKKKILSTAAMQLRLNAVTRPPLEVPLRGSGGGTTPRTIQVSGVSKGTASSKAKSPRITLIHHPAPLTPRNPSKPRPKPPSAAKGSSMEGYHHRHSMSKLIDQKAQSNSSSQNSTPRDSAGSERTPLATLQDKTHHQIMADLQKRAETDVKSLLGLGLPKGALPTTPRQQGWALLKENCPPPSKSNKVNPNIKAMRSSASEVPVKPPKKEEPVRRSLDPEVPVGQLYSFWKRGNRDPSPPHQSKATTPRSSAGGSSTTTRTATPPTVPRQSSSVRPPRTSSASSGSDHPGSGVAKGALSPRGGSTGGGSYASKMQQVSSPWFEGQKLQESPGVRRKGTSARSLALSQDSPEAGSSEKLRGRLEEAIAQVRRNRSQCRTDSRASNGLSDDSLPPSRPPRSSSVTTDSPRPDPAPAKKVTQTPTGASHSPRLVPGMTDESLKDEQEYWEMVRLIETILTKKEEGIGTVVGEQLHPLMGPAESTKVVAV